MIKYLPEWIEDLCEVYMDLESSPNGRVYFVNWLNNNSYRVPKSEKEAVCRIKQYLKYNPFIKKRKWKTESHITNVYNINVIIENSK